MKAKIFFLVGKEDRQNISLEVSNSDDVGDLKHDLASYFGITRPDCKLFRAPFKEKADFKAAISLHGSDGGLNTVEQLLEYSDKIGIRVDGKSIRDPFCPVQVPFFGNNLQLHPDHMGNHDRLFQKYGSVIKTVNLGTTTYLTDDPEVAEVLLSESEYFTKTTSDSNHPLHYMNDNTALFTMDSASPAFKLAHKFVPPSMSPRAIRRHTRNMHNSVTECFNVFDELDALDQSFNVYHYMFKLAGQIIYRVVLGMDVGHFQSIDTPPHIIICLFGEYLELQKQTQMSPRWFKYLPFGVYPRLQRVHNELWGMMDKIMQECEVGGNGKDMPINECAVNSTCIADFLNRATDDKGEKLPRELRLSNVTALIGAGFATSSCLLSWLLYSLCNYPGNLQDRILEELIDHGATENREWTYDEILAMPFLDAVVKETHRLHNPAYQTARNTKRDVILPSGWLIPAQSVVIPTIPSIHRNKDHWENPQRFDPERWLGGKNANSEGRHKLAYMPFATGPRGCVGYNVAHLEARIVVAKMVFRYKFVDVSTEPMEYDPDFLVIRPLNVYVRAMKRTSWPSKLEKSVC